MSTKSNEDAVFQVQDGGVLMRVSVPGDVPAPIEWVFICPDDGARGVAYEYKDGTFNARCPKCGHYFYWRRYD